jgi:hypothetical protein
MEAYLAMKSRILTDQPSVQPLAEPIAILFFVLGLLLAASFMHGILLP